MGKLWAADRRVTRSQAGQPKAECRSGMKAGKAVQTSRPLTRSQVRHTQPEVSICKTVYSDTEVDKNVLKTRGTVLSSRSIRRMTRLQSMRMQQSIQPEIATTAKGVQLANVSEVAKPNSVLGATEQVQDVGCMGQEESESEVGFWFSSSNLVQVDGQGSRNLCEFEQRQSSSCDGDRNFWTSEQEDAFLHAYVSVKPSSDFLVPGKSADECFNKLYSETTSPVLGKAPKRQRCNAEAEEVGIALSPIPKRRVSKRRRLLEAHRAVRSILKKQQADDEDYEDDAFEVLEQSEALGSITNSELVKDQVLSKSEEMFSFIPPLRSDYLGHPARKTVPKEKENVDVCAKSRKGLKPSDSQSKCISSPEVLKMVKSPVQLERYIDHWHRTHRVRKPKSVTSRLSGDSLDSQSRTIRDAKEKLNNIIRSNCSCVKDFEDKFYSVEEDGEDEEELDQLT